MTAPVRLSSALVQTDIRRDSPRPHHLRQEDYADLYDWKTLFYDVYRCGKHVVLQGPPLFNLLNELKKARPFANWFTWPFPKAKYINLKKRGEIWVKTDASHIAFEGTLGSFDLKVQPDGSDRFAGKRVLVTQSKNNRIGWIADWLRFHHVLQGADAALIYDNGSSDYDIDQLQSELSLAVPDMDVLVISWPFPFGPQAGPLWEMEGGMPDWDSDFCQVGVVQHARFRFLQKARSVMHNDIDEMIISQGDRTVFEAAEQSPNGMVKFDGRWISTHSDHPVEPGKCSHADFVHDEGEHAELSPPKWCIRPQAFSRKHSWGVHNIFGARGNDEITDEFLFRHIRGVTTSWHYDRWNLGSEDRSALRRDEVLANAWEQAGLKPSHVTA
ncbi:glycosyltransferase family 92 protein [Aurantiacibacter sediminis]|uniref:Glycosyltransferase family 92 protein n=1 Tax=Aurantiacibacter sediminis TaxID=2793064 RepID=A0ABS0N1I7_9SPHN|nr:glycosyltransferase family 92 protein [Aurantiacibacter sediminis]MBH5321823.1 glycosyltransferase family 92 protein [Aurantiacibacter sediminis]